MQKIGLMLHAATYRRFSKPTIYVGFESAVYRRFLKPTICGGFENLRTAEVLNKPPYTVGFAKPLYIVGFYILF